MSKVLEVDTSVVEANIQKFMEQQLPKGLLEGMEKVCLKVEADSKKNCPGEKGTLRQSITHTIEELEDGIMGYVGSNLEYAPYVHQGTGIYAKEGNGRKEVPWKYKDAEGEWHATEGIKPKPFIQDAIDENRDAIIEFFKGVMGND
jgi:hypothetical protein